MDIQHNDEGVWQESDDNDASASEPFCAGLPFTGHRSLQDEERAVLRAAALRLRKQGKTVLHACFHLGWICGGVLFVDRVMSARTSSAAIFFGMNLLFMLLLVFLWVLFEKQSWLGRSRALERDLQAGYVLGFQGTLTVLEPFDPTQELLLRAHLLVPSKERVQCLEVLPVSNRIWRVNGQAPGAWIGALCFVDELHGLFADQFTERRPE